MVKTEAPLTIQFKLDKGVTGYIIAYDDKRRKVKIGSIDFYIDWGNRCIMVTDCTMENDFKNEGYGTLLMKILFAYASGIGLSIKLYSLRDAVPFYQKLGFKKIPNEDSTILPLMVWKE